MRLCFCVAENNDANESNQVNFYSGLDKYTVIQNQDNTVKVELSLFYKGGRGACTGGGYNTYGYQQ